MEHVTSTLFISTSIRRHSFAAPRSKLRRCTQQIKRVCEQENIVSSYSVSLFDLVRTNWTVPSVARSQKRYYNPAKGNGWSKNNTKRRMETSLFQAFSYSWGAKMTNEKIKEKHGAGSHPSLAPGLFLFYFVLPFSRSSIQLTERLKVASLRQVSTCITQWLLNNTWKSSKMAFIWLLFLTAMI